MSAKLAWWETLPIILEPFPHTLQLFAMSSSNVSPPSLPETISGSTAPRMSNFPAPTKW